VRAFEQTLLASYQTYLTDLELLSKSTILPWILSFSLASHQIK
jgi:hypothetical protein